MSRDKIRGLAWTPCTSFLASSEVAELFAEFCGSTLSLLDSGEVATMDWLALGGAATIGEGVDVRGLLGQSQPRHPQ